MSSYLAIFGMYRGSSFLLDNRAAIFCNVINDFLNIFTFDDIQTIYDKNCLHYNKEFINKIASTINNNLKQFYNNDPNRKEDTQKQIKRKSKNINNLLITKIILGVFCLTPAIDSRVSNSINNIKESLPGNYFKHISKIHLLITICDVCLEDPKLKAILTEASPCFDKISEKYPVIRTIDLALWQ